MVYKMIATRLEQNISVLHSYFTAILYGIIIQFAKMAIEYQSSFYIFFIFEFV